MKLISVFVLLFLMAQSSFAGLLYTYSQLALKDLDQMSKIIQDKMKESQKSGGDKVIPLKEALQAVYSRPNEDALIDKIVNPLRNALEEHNAYESAIKALVKEAIGAIKNPRAFKPVTQVTYIVFLENMMAELKPRATQDFEKSVLETIRNAKIEISKEAQKERKLRMMKDSVSPSVIAEQLLTPVVVEEKLEEKKDK